MLQNLVCSVSIAKTPKVSTISPKKIRESVQSSKQLKEILAYVYENSDDLAVARVQVRIADEEVNRAKSGLRPGVSTEATHTVTRTKDSRKGPYANYNMIDPNPGVGVTFSQHLFDFGATESGIAQADKSVLAARCELIVSEQNVFFQVIKAIATIKQAEESITIRNAQEKDSAIILEQTRTKHIVGTETKVSVDLAVANYEQTKAAITEAEGELDKAKAEYSYVTKTQPPAHLEMLPVVEGLPKSLEELQNLALKHHPSILNARYKLEAALEAIEAARREVSPSLDVSAQARRDLHGRDTPYGDGRYGANTSNVRIGLTVPLYQPRAYPQIRQAQEQAFAARRQLELARLKVKQECTTVWTSLLTLEAQIRQIQSSIVAQRESVRGALEGKAAGTTSIFEIIQAQEQLYKYIEQLSRQQSGYIQTQYQFLMLVGRLTARHLALPVKLYDPKENYEKFAGSWVAFKDKKALELDKEEHLFNVTDELPPVGGIPEASKVSSTPLTQKKDKEKLLTEPILTTN